MSEPLLVFDQVSHQYAASGKTAGAWLPVLRDISLELQPGEIVCVVGVSGCGKSTLLQLAAGLMAPTSGGIYVRGQRVTGPGMDRAMMFQEDTLFPWLTVRDNIAFGPQCRRDMDRLKEVPELIEWIGLAGFETYYPAQLSGGMRQRAAIARALINHAQILLLDEPFAALDAQTREEMQELLLTIHQRVRPGILMVTHDIEEAVFLGDRVVVLESGGTGGHLVGNVTTGLTHPRTAEMREYMHLAALRAQLRGWLRTGVQ